MLDPLDDTVGELNESSLFEIAYFLDNSMYSSKKLELGRLTDYVVEKTRDAFTLDYGLGENIDFNYLKNGVDCYLDGSETEVLKGEHIFSIAPTVNGRILDNFDSNKKRVATVETLSAFTSEYSPLFLSDSSDFITNYYNVETQQTLEQHGIAHAPSTETEKHNAFIFRMVGTQSLGTWECPRSGWFMCYGWVDEESHENNDTVSRWVALEGEFDGEWKILQFFPIVANTDSAQYCSYVTFSLPVHKGLKLRLRSGFKVGTNSGLYWNVRGSMTSHIANAFVGGIYSGFKFIS